MDSASVQEIFEAVLPDDAIDSIVQASGMQKRERVPGATLRPGGDHLGGVDSRRSTIRDPRILFSFRRSARGAGYGWFNGAFEHAMAMVSDRAMSYARLQPLDFPGWLGRDVRDWHAVDSMTVKLDKTLMTEFPGAGDYAALKIHRRYSLGLGTTVDYHLSPAREHDAPHLVLDVRALPTTS